MDVAMLLFHALLAVALIGALTHQALSVWWPASAGERNFFGNFRAVRAAVYTRGIVLLFIVTATMGGIIYPIYRTGARVAMEEMRLKMPLGYFDMKEHYIALGLGMLPAYWYYWKQPLSTEFARTRAIITAVLALAVWWSFIVGHVLNNIRGF